MSVLRRKLNSMPGVMRDSGGNMCIGKGRGGLGVLFKFRELRVRTVVS